MSIIVSGVSFHYFQDQSLFEGVSMSVVSGGKVSIVGDNGMGKTTLLKLIAGKMAASQGSIDCASRPYYVAQQVGLSGISVAEALCVSEKIEALHAIYDGSDRWEHYDTLSDDWQVESRCRAALEMWGLGGVDLMAPIDSLSGGEQSKLFLAGISIHKPSVILLDEPTNHLDYTSRRILYNFISNCKATVVVVSHDITLLNLVDSTYVLSPNGVRLYGGNYDFYKSQSEIEQQALGQQIGTEETALRLARKLAQEVAQRQERRVSRGARETSGIPRIILKGRQDKGENTATKLAIKHVGIIEDKQQNLVALRQKQRIGGELKIDFEDAQLLHSGKLLIRATAINFGYTASGLIWRDPLSIEVRSGDRIHITGDNGSGKTTLLRLLTSQEQEQEQNRNEEQEQSQLQLQPTTGTIKRANFSSIYLDQELAHVNTSQSVLSLAQRYNYTNLFDHQIKLRLHRALFPKQMWDKPCNTLSGGERMRLYLCCLMISGHAVDLFVLDEPTNNLDLSSLEILTDTIKNYRGTLLVISHDQRFTDQIGITKVIEL